MKISIPVTPVLTKVFRIQGASVKVQYSIDVEKNDPWNEESIVSVYSVNGAPVTLFTRAVREEMDMLIREHAVNVLNEYDNDKGCGHDEYLSRQMN